MGVKKNFLYSSVLTVSNYFFPLLTYPYVSRVLGVTNIGICNFVDSIVNYFVLFASLGIVSVGIREIASNRDDSEKLNNAFTNLFAFNAFATTIALVSMLLAMYLVPQLQSYRILLWIGIIKLLGNAFQFEWLYKGLEEFKYITNRTIFVKMLYVASVFVFVRTKADINIYFLLSTLMVAVNACINVVHSRCFVHLRLREVYLWKYSKPILILGLYAVLTSMYTTFNVSYLGFVQPKEEVGLYTTATKLHHIIIAIYTAFTGVMMPRMSSLLSQGKKDEFLQMTSKSINVLVTIAIPILVFTIIFASDIVTILAGSEYARAAIPTRIIMPLILVIGLNQIFIVQIMTPMHQEKYISRNSILGALTGVSLNLMLVPVLGCIGSALVWFLSELVIHTSSYICVRKILGVKYPFEVIFKNLVAYLPAVIICLAIFYMLIIPPLLRLFFGGVFIVLYFFSIQYYYLKNGFVLDMIEMSKTKIFSRLI